MARGKHEGTWQRIRPNTYRAAIMLGGKRKSSTHPSREDALRWLAGERAKHKALAGGGEITLGEYLSAWLPQLRTGDRTEKTWAEHRHNALCHLEPLHRYTLDQLAASPALIRAHLASVRQSLAARTVMRVRSTLNLALRRAVRDRVLLVNPVEQTDAPRVERVEQQVLSRAEQAQLLKSAAERGDRLRCLWVLNLRIGARLSELLGLVWSDVDWDKGTLTIHRQLVSSAGVPSWRPRAKTESGTRIVHLPRSALEELRAHKLRQDAERTKAWPDYGLIFTTKLGTPLWRDYARKAWMRACRDAGVPVIKFHGGRHTAASTYIAAGVPITEVAHILGHADPSITSKIYSHSLAKYSRGAADRLDVFLDDAGSEITRE